MPHCIFVVRAIVSIADYPFHPGNSLRVRPDIIGVVAPDERWPVEQRHYADQRHSPELQHEPVPEPALGPLPVAAPVVAVDDVDVAARPVVGPQSAAGRPAAVYHEGPATAAEEQAPGMPEDTTIAEYQDLHVPAVVAVDVVVAAVVAVAAAAVAADVAATAIVVVDAAAEQSAVG